MYARFRERTSSTNLGRKTSSRVSRKKTPRLVGVGLKDWHLLTSP